jgi:hypothetical protein
MTAAPVVGGLVYYPRNERGKRRGIWEILAVHESHLTLRIRWVAHGGYKPQEFCVSYRGVEAVDILTVLSVTT